MFIAVKFKTYEPVSYTARTYEEIVAEIRNRYALLANDGDVCSYASAPGIAVWTAPAKKVISARPLYGSAPVDGELAGMPIRFEVVEVAREVEVPLGSRYGLVRAVVEAVLWRPEAGDVIRAYAVAVRQSHALAVFKRATVVIPYSFSKKQIYVLGSSAGILERGKFKPVITVGEEVTVEVQDVKAGEAYTVIAVPTEKKPSCENVA